MNGTALKSIAVCSMLLDHTGAVLFPELIWLRYVGRIAFPIYCFLIVEGFVHTRNLAGYMMRLMIFGLLSEVPFDIAFYNTIVYIDYQNVFWTLLLGLFAVSFMSLVRIKDIRIRIPVQILIAVPFGIIAQLAHTDYRWVGVAMISVMYLFRQTEPFRIVGSTVLMLPAFSTSIEYIGALAFIPLHFYNGKRGVDNQLMKWTFYLFYPLHLIALSFIRDKLLWI